LRDDIVDEWASLPTDQVSGELALCPSTPVAPAKGPLPYLVGILGSVADQEVSIDTETIVGRHPKCDVQIRAADVSRKHARLTRSHSGDCVLEDLDSRNGTLVNGNAVRVCVLHHGDTVQLGFQTSFVFCAQGCVLDHVADTSAASSTQKLAAGVAHHYNNLSAAMEANLNYLASLSEHTPIGDQNVRECLADLRTAVQRTTTITQQLIGFARLGKYEDRIVDISEVARGVVRQLKRSASEVKSSIEPGLRVFGDEAQLRQVFVNLGNNALEATGDRGWLWVKASLVQQQRASSAEGLAGPQVCISVTDSGPGVDEQSRDHVFEPFYSTKGPTRGTGLGLAAVYGIVDNHGGHIRMDSAPGAGTTFTVTLPAVTAGAFCIGGEDEETEQSKVLLAANDVVGDHVEALLHQLGLPVCRADSSPQALSRLLDERGHTWLAIVDLSLDSLGGAETGRLLSRVEPQLRLLYVGQANPGAPLALLESRAGRFITTPLTRTTLQSALARLLQNSR